MRSATAPGLETPEAEVRPLGASASRADVLGLPVDGLTMTQTRAWMAAAVDAATRTRTSAPADQPEAARQLVTLNPEMVMRARHDPGLRAAIHAADRVVADGVGVLWATRLLGALAPERVTGVDLLDAFCSVAAMRGYRVFLLGAAQGVAQEAACVLAERHPGLRVAGTQSGSPDEADAPALLARLRAAQPDALFVAFGSPAQECWIARYRGQLGAAVAIGVGGAFDMLAGRVPRAPYWMRRAGLEWSYRLVRQPWRWRRMLALPGFALLVAGAAARAQIGSHAAPATLETSGDHRGQR
jgi:N-acetylglucosaminyldiphosphoundecaprenol N-acetyl-beta-D-mannosaminyltransferase